MTTSKNSPESVNTKRKAESYKKKVEKLIENLKAKQEIKVKACSSTSTSSRSSTNSKRLYNLGASFSNRFQAQKQLIETQKVRIKEQERIINDLKLGILTEEVRYTLNNSKHEIRDIFSDCKSKLVGKTPIDYLPVEEKFSIKPKSAPKFIQELEKRAYERMKYREMIKERKRIIEETKRKFHEEALERKRILEEEERKQQLEKIKERRNEELEKMKKRQEQKEKYMKNVEKSMKLYNKVVTKRAFSIWKLVYKTSCEKFEMSEEYYTKRILRKCFHKLKKVVEMKYAIQVNKANKCYEKIMTKRAFGILKRNRLEAIRNMQTAHDYYDFSILKNTFESWLRHMCKERILKNIKIQRSIHHHRKKLLFQSFFRLKMLKTVLKLEKAKEERKQKWRLKVLEILPDFNCSQDNDSTLTLTF